MGLSPPACFLVPNSEIESSLYSKSGGLRPGTRPRAVQTSEGLPRGAWCSPLSGGGTEAQAGLGPVSAAARPPEWGAPGSGRLSSWSSGGGGGGVGFREPEEQVSLEQLCAGVGAAVPTHANPCKRTWPPYLDRSRVARHPRPWLSGRGRCPPMSTLGAGAVHIPGVHVGRAGGVCVCERVRARALGWVRMWGAGEEVDPRGWGSVSTCA